jgi:DNA modification methylase
MDPYRQFLEAKVRMAPETGFDVAPQDLHPVLKPHQRDVVRWALRGGRRAIFKRFGLGKTVDQLEIMRQILLRHRERALITVPLGVRQEFRRDARMLDMEWRFIRRTDQADAPGLYLTNYESVRDGKVDPTAFIATSLDEASVLRSFGSKTFQVFLDLFRPVEYRFVATATPSPNRYKELIHYAGFLGVMDTGQALTRFFQRNSEQANDLTLYPHKEREFWLWVSSWAVFLQKPSDLGYPDEGYDLPPVTMHWHEVPADIAGGGEERDGQGLLFRDAAIGVADAAREKRDTLPVRIAKMREILAAAPDEHALIWHDLEVERHAIEAAVPGVVSVYGSQDLDDREAAMVGFAEGRIKHLAAKPVIAGSGPNFQHHCAMAVYLGIGFKFNDFIQSFHRIVRFLQRRPVHVHAIYSEREREVRRDLEAKWARHDEMAEKMTEILRTYGLDGRAMAATLQRSIGVERIEAQGQNWTVANNDCVEETRTMEDDSVDLIVTSVPFSNHYEYTPSYNDFGHTDDDDHFFRQMDFLTPELLRVLKPGRLAAVHVKDRILFGSVTGLGFPTVNPFHAKCLFHAQKHGFAYMGMIFIDTDVVRENNQTYRLGYTEMRKDGTKMGVGSPEFVLLLRKPPTDRSKSYADDPVVKAIDDYSLARWQLDAHARWRSSGNRLLTPEEIAALPPGDLVKLFRAWSVSGVYDFETHLRIGETLEARGVLPSTFMALQPGTAREDVWDNVNRMRTLNNAQAAKGREQHVCPLQFDIVDRLINRFSSPGELVYDPFGGLFTVPLRALHLGRRGRASELNGQYFVDGISYLKAAERELSVPSLFDLDGLAAPPVAAE